jgi:Flp pilus assembly protein TadD
VAFEAGLILRKIGRSGNTFGLAASKKSRRTVFDTGSFAMSARRLLCIAVIAVASTMALPYAMASDLKITLPKRSQLTPVQRLNREGVEAVHKQQYEKAQTLFYKAYLFDPDDPFTLYNLGYISELQGQLERAQKFYTLAAAQASDAVISRASLPQLEGKRMKDALGNLQDATMQVNRQNVEAMRLLAEGRAPEAELVLRQTLTIDPRNAFTLNNLGVAKEAEGELEEAMKYYAAAAASHSTDAATVTVDRAWRGKPAAEMAAANEAKVRQSMQDMESARVRAAILNLRGVAAVNRNDWRDAGQDFLKAYSLDPNSAFSLNNLGYLAEMDGDLETAEFFYEKARQAEGAGDRVWLASRRSADGHRLSDVAGESDQQVDAKMEAKNAARRRQSGPIELKRRDNQPVNAQPDGSQPPSPPQTAPQPMTPGPATSPPPVSQPPMQ